MRLRVFVYCVCFLILTINAISITWKDIENDPNSVSPKSPVENKKIELMDVNFDMTLNTKLKHSDLCYNLMLSMWIIKLCNIAILL